MTTGLKIIMINVALSSTIYPRKSYRDAIQSGELLAIRLFGMFIKKNGNLTPKSAA